jgi:hypothetical protein
MQLRGLPAAARARLHTGELSISELFVSGALYMGSPLFAAELPGGASWLKLDLTRIEAAEGIDPSAIASGESNPAEFLQELAKAGSAVRKVAREEVRGVQTTRYAAKVNLLKAAESQPGTNVARAREAFGKIEAEIGGSMPVEVWVDGHGLMRKTAIALKLKVNGKTIAEDIDIEYFGFGPVPAVNLPASSETYDATDSAVHSLSGEGG